MRKICIWPDNTWCFLKNLEEYHWKSDDYIVEEVPDHWTEDDIDYYVNDTSGD